MCATRFGRGISAASATAEAAAEALDDATAQLDGDDDIALAIVMGSPDYDVPTLVDAVQDRIGDVPLVGSTSAGEFTDERVTEGGLVVALVASDGLTVASSLADGVSTDVFGTVQTAVNGLPEIAEMDGEHTAAITFHNGLAGKGEEITLITRQLLGEVPLAGGSAGDDLELEETTVFTEDGVSTDGVAIVVLAGDKPFGLAANHGHTTLSETYEVTAADGNVLHELDGEPAFEVWKREIADTAREEYGLDVGALTPDDEEFAVLLNQFELGLETSDGSYKIRWPAMTDSTDGPLKFATAISEGSEVRIMHSPKEEQIESARGAAADSLANFDGDEVSGALVFDCVCRGLILGDEFGTAVEEIANELGVPVAGFETYGEISMPVDARSGYHNTTTSILLLPS